jgi:hypothetical protein
MDNIWTCSFSQEKGGTVGPLWFPLTLFISEILRARTNLFKKEFQTGLFTIHSHPNSFLIRI